LDDAAFDAMALTSILEKALGERDRVGGSLAKRVGVGGTALGVLLMLHVPGHPVLGPFDYRAEDESEEQAWVRELLERNLARDTSDGRWLAAIVARRSLEANHLWEDLGLPDRAALTRLMQRHFSPLATLNAGGQMRWKRFFYRQLCEEEGMTHCTSPTCSNCPDVPRCFAPDSAEALIARSKQPPA
jgi:nitrogen fixation protein NifQ